MKLKEVKKNELWEAKPYKIVKKPLVDNKFVYHVYVDGKYLAYCKTYDSALDQVKKHKTR
jgi:hypothetical protein